jgi:hypothetical protein
MAQGPFQENINFFMHRKIIRKFNCSTEMVVLQMLEAGKLTPRNRNRAIEIVICKI